MKLQKLFTVVAMITILAFSSCETFNFEYEFIKGEGPIVEKELFLSDFSQINLTSSFDVVVSQGNTQSVYAVGHENIIDRVRTNVNNDQWNISLENGSYSNFQLTIYITVPEIEQVRVAGSGSIEIEDFYQINDLTLEIMGSGNIIMNGIEMSDNLFVNIQGSGSVYANKSVTCFKSSSIKIGGSGDFKGLMVKSEVCDVTINGSGKCYVQADEELNANIFGSGNLYYKGDPRIYMKGSGSGRLICLN